MSAVKSYQLLGIPVATTQTPTTAVAQAAWALKQRGFTVLTAQFGSDPSITVAATVATWQLTSECTGVYHDGGHLYATYTAHFEGVTVLWHKRIRPKLTLH